ncbi:MAG: Glycine--tRNA ligase beta subunit [Syntrophorhabdus sp. PtaU1.Bin050]|nr:MAG: Glycine--tRNA ligase beta subunit [Syntrophorhabdus sp. PtaU1.Bin050]
MRTLLLEIGVEEIPARFIEPAKEGLSRLLHESLSSSRIPFGAIETLSTPRRLTAFVYDVSERQEEMVTVKFGPPYNRAFDESGNPTKAATGFARSQGVEVEELRKGQKDGIDFVVVEKTEGGKETAAILPGLLRDVIGRIPFQKRMRWGSESFEFARPIQWILVLYGREPIEMGIADVKSSNITFGHRFLSNGPITINDPSEYVDTLRANSVIINETERMAIIEQGITTIEKEVQGKAIRDMDLIKEILYITEYPYPLKGGFDPAFLKIPKEVLVNVMKSHQRYIPVVDGNKALMPYFICFANTIPADDMTVVKGNEKVLRARLADAEFFFEEDKKTSLSDLYERLSTIVFHVKLGTLKDKTDRLTSICRYLCHVLGYADMVKMEKAVRVAKSDLLTHMVGEFPELQGVMGRIYAKDQGEDDEVALSIEEHYLPSGGNGALPVTGLGAIIAVADKIDSLASFFSVGISPTGNLDPFALRRQTLGIIKIVIDRKLHIRLDELIKTAYDSGEKIAKRLSFEETKALVTDFIVARFKFSMIDEGRNQEFVESVLPLVSTDIYDGYLRLMALESQKSVEDFQRLMIGFKRAYNITKQVADEHDVDTSFFKEKEEQALFDVYEGNKEAFFSTMDGRRYDEAIAILVSFKEGIDRYFDKVFVMDKDEGIKNNRLALLKKIRDMFLTYGDFSKIRIE